MDLHNYDRDRRSNAQQPVRTGRGMLGNRRNPAILLAALAIVCVGILLVHSSALQAADSRQAPVAHDVEPVRIGTYDSRAVAVAYARSDLMRQKLAGPLKELAEAKKAGDQKRVDELNAMGESMQIRLHLQGFSNARVDDILDVVRDELPNVAAQMNVAVITNAINYHNASVELVDVTDELVALFHPDPETLKIVADARALEPLPIEDVARMPANE